MEQLLDSELGRNVAVAMVSVILGFLSSFAIAAYSERKKPASESPMT
jgi:multisubunit Na+/H+ antiporter MnhF subunit